MAMRATLQPVRAASANLRQPVRKFAGGGHGDGKYTFDREPQRLPVPPRHPPAPSTVAAVPPGMSGRIPRRRGYRCPLPPPGGGGGGGA